MTVKGVAVGLFLCGMAGPARAEVDLRLGDLAQIQQVGRIGAYPGGTTGLTMTTTSCNDGTENISWLAVMAEDHPGIAMQLYRELDGRFEQIGVSWIVHCFTALPGSACDECTLPSDGTFLPPQCSNTYSTATHADRAHLGPRDEWDPHAGTWECTGSHFAGGEPDCVRRHDGAGHDPVEHRLIAADADLGLAGASYFYEACYLVRGDANRRDNLGSRRCTMLWTGSSWAFQTPAGGNPLVAGPALERWGERRTWVSAGSGDGDLLLAVETTDLGGGLWRFEYALFNLDCARGVRGFRVPVAPGAPSGIGFHDSDGDASSDWPAEFADDELRWRTAEFAENPEANALDYGLLFNFRFDVAAPPGETSVTLELFRPGVGASVPVATTGPALPSSVSAAPRPGILGPAQPNPLAAGSMALPVALPADASIRLEVFAPDGRRVRLLAEGWFAAGAHEFSWDGAGEDGARVAPGVYLARLSAGGQASVRPVVIME